MQNQELEKNLRQDDDDESLNPVHPEETGDQIKNKTEDGQTLSRESRLFNDLNKLALSRGKNPVEEQGIIDTFNGRVFQSKLKTLAWSQYLTVQANYLRTHYGMYATAASGFMSAIVFLGVMALNPALLPFGMAALTGYLKYTVAAGYLALGLASGVYFVPRTKNEIKKLAERVEDQELSTYDNALLGTSVVLGSAFVGGLYLMPSMLPFFGGLSTLPKLASAATVSALTAVAGYTMFKGRQSRSAGNAILESSSKDDRLTSSAPMMTRSGH